MNILLTGSTGFVGLAMAKKLVGHSVRHLSRNVSSQNEPHCYQKDISGEEDFYDCLNGIDIVIHAAARVHLMSDKSVDPLFQFMSVNCHGTLKLARQAADAGVKRFIFISSIKVNGEETALDRPFKFDDVRRPNDFYSVSKAEAEIELLKISEATDLEVVIIRPPLVYGPQSKGNLSSLIKIIKFNIPLPFASINNSRSLVGIDNLIDLILTCLDHPNATNQIFLVSDDDNISTCDLIRQLSAVFDKHVYLFSFPISLLTLISVISRRKGLMTRLCGNLEVDISHTKECLNWQPPLTFRQGLVTLNENRS